ncbi:MAG TPA: ABC transporter substrate-binding protein, partial [Microlunatus sp.]|nr:ABC transporter substrate-binding protein [Microlunatus sp.]
MTLRRWILIGLAVVVVLAGAGGFLFWRSEAQQPETRPAPAQPVGIAIPKAPEQIKIGVLITLTGKPGQGAEWKAAAEGARVAAERLAMGGVSVQLSAVDDKGTEKGARRAVQQLAEEGVTGIVAASQGSHLEGAVAAAQEAGVPLLLPYEPDADLLGKWIWSTGPQDEAIGAALQASLQADERKRTLLVDVGGGAPESVEVFGKLRFEPGDDVKDLIKQISARTSTSKKIDSVLISGPAAQQAVVVQALQGADLTVPVTLTPEALSPAFAEALVAADGSLSTSLASVGTDTDDAAALGSDASGKAVAAFLSATRMLASDPEQKSLLGDRPFAEVAAGADVRSHDAVIALAYAATALARTGESDPVATIAGLRLDHSNGLAGPVLDFSHGAALDPEAVVAL